MLYSLSRRFIKFEANALRHFVQTERQTDRQTNKVESSTIADYSCLNTTCL